jgi:GNAT superfamily N-acetyltransferase
MELLLRDAEGDDLPALRDVFRRSSLSNESDREVLLRHAEALEFSSSSLAVGRCRVATINSSGIVGFATTMRVVDRLELEDLFVDPDWMRRGVGRALIHDVLVYAKAKRIARLEVTGNPHAMTFYEKVGFAVYSQVQTEFGPGYRLRLDLPPTPAGP